MTADHVFGGDVARFYQELLVPMIFEDAAHATAQRAAALVPPDGHLLEIAAGTGAVTRALSQTLPPSVAITATDLNQAMLDRAVEVGTGGRAVTWQQADVIDLPFDDATFDVVVCQFGAMFFPDRPAAYGEVRRVLRAPHGRFLCAVWDRIEANEIAAVVDEVVAAELGTTEPLFLRRTPYAYFDADRIEADLRAGGFTGDVQIDPFNGVSRSPSARLAAAAFTEGSVLRAEIIDTVGPERLTELTEAATEAVAARFPPGADGTVTARIRAWLIDARI